MGEPRSAALSVLEKCRRSGAWSDAVLGSVMDREGLKGPDRGLCAALCYGVLQNRSWLDNAVGTASTVPLNRVEPKVLDILRLSLYQLFFLQKIPAYAAVSEGVALCRASGCTRAAGYVNAVLRRLAALEKLPEPKAGGAEGLSIRWSHPRWLVEELLSALGEEETEAFLRLDNKPAPACFQVNTLRTTAEALAERLRAEGIETHPDPFVPNCLRAEAPGDLKRSPAFQEGLFYVQDAAAKFAVLTAAPRPGERVLDVCAAPGGKSFAAAVAAEGAANITACDLHENKLKRIREGAARLGLEMEILAADARSFREDWMEQYDLVIADVPCSGLGVIRKKPDIRWKDPKDFAGLPRVQRDILENVSRYLRPGGRLLYSTCTVRKEENDELVGAFLEGHPDFSPLPFADPAGAEQGRGMLQLWPQRHGTDGFFVAMMRKML